MIRPFEIRDLPMLHRYRARGIFLNTPITLTWGPVMVPMRAAISPVSNAIGIYTAVSRGGENGETMIGQVRHIPGREDAHFTYLAPALKIDPGGFQEMVEYLVKKLGEHQAQNLIAEVEESSDCFELLRRAGFSIYARQHIWKITSLPKQKRDGFSWQEIASLDEFNARKLYHAVVPTMVQQVETSPWDELQGWVLYQNGELMAYAYINEGPRGIWMQPYIDSEVADFPGQLTSLLAHLRPRERRPVYVCLRSYQGGIAPHLEALGGEMSESQAVMVRRLTASVKKPELVRIPAINGKAEASTPYNHNTEGSR
jgi:hypothetical protein